jgi:hypothetical protein
MIAEVTKAKSSYPEYQNYISMKYRCENPNSNMFRHYGGRGVTVCERWRNDFWAFYEDMGPRPENTDGVRWSIDRIDVNGNYEPHNCRWSNDDQQARNKRDTVYFEYNGVRLSSQEWAKILGCEIPALTMRRKRGWTDTEIISTPIAKPYRPRKDGGRVRGPSRGHGLYDAWMAHHFTGGPVA